MAGLQQEPPTQWQMGLSQGSRLDPPSLGCSQGMEGSSSSSRMWLCSFQERWMVQAWKPKEKWCLWDFVLRKGAEGVPPL